MPLLKQLAHCPDKRQHSPTNANKHQQLGQCAAVVIVRYCRTGYSCRMSAQCREISNILTARLPARNKAQLACVTSSSSLGCHCYVGYRPVCLKKKKRYHKSIYRLAYPNERFSRQIFVCFNFYDSFNTATRSEERRVGEECR